MLLGPADDTMAKPIASYAALPHVRLMQVRFDERKDRASDGREIWSRLVASFRENNGRYVSDAKLFFI